MPDRDRQMPIRDSVKNRAGPQSCGQKLLYDTRSIVHFEALEQTPRLYLVSGHADR